MVCENGGGDLCMHAYGVKRVGVLFNIGEWG